MSLLKKGEKMKKRMLTRMEIVEVSTKTFGRLGLVLFLIAVMLVVSLNSLYGIFSMLIGMAIFICGGFGGRCIQKQLSKI